jgi:hypothetical protein
MSHVVSVQVPSTGIELQLDCGMTIYVYRSQIDDRVVVHFPYWFCWIPQHVR